MKLLSDNRSHCYPHVSVPSNFPQSGYGEEPEGGRGGGGTMAGRHRLAKTSLGTGGTETKCQGEFKVRKSEGVFSTFIIVLLS